MVETIDRRGEYRKLSEIYFSLVTITQRKRLQFSEWCKPYWFKLEGKAIEVRLPDGRNTTGYEVISRSRGDDIFAFRLAEDYERATNITFTFIQDAPESHVETRNDNGRAESRKTGEDLSTRTR